MTPDPLTTALLFLLIPLLLFLLLAYWLDKNKEQMRFRLGFEENKRQRPRNSHLSLLITQPDNTRVWGCDESGTWAGIVDWKVTKSRGASFGIIKCTEGTVNIKYFRENLDGVLAAGLIGGAYHWLHRHSVVSCKLQAEAAWNKVKDYPKTLPLFVDFETTYYNKVLSNPGYADLDVFVTEYTRLSGRKPILYTSQGYMRQWGTVPAALRAKLGGLWIANYNATTPALPSGYVGWDFWQFSAEGNASVLTPNTAGKLEVDLDYYNGSVSGLRMLAGLEDTTPIPDPEPIGETMQYQITYDSGANVRTGPGITFPIVSSLPDNAVVTVVEVRVTNVTTGETWGRMENNNWFAIKYNGKVRAVEVTPPAPSPAGYDLQIDAVEITIHATRLSDGSKWKAAYTQAGLNLEFMQE